MNTPVSFEIAKLLKEKGFEQRTKSYTKDGKLVTVSLTIRRFNPEETYYPAPTIGEAVMWLYEKHGIWISVDFKETDESFQYCCRLIHSDNLPRIFCNDGFNNPTEAYEAAILYTLNNLI